jgi:hypothetical protein
VARIVAQNAAIRHGGATRLKLDKLGVTGSIPGSPIPESRMVIGIAPVQAM